MKRLLAILAVCILVPSVEADEITPPETTLCTPTKLISFEKFDQPEAFGRKGKPGSHGWRAGIGEWSIVDGIAYAKQEGPSDKRPNGHEAVCEHVVEMSDLVLTAEFKMGDSPQVGFVCRDINKPNLHLGRVLITPKAIWIQKMSGIAKETRREELTRVKVDLDRNAWHQVVVEVCGDRWVARIDNHTLEAEHARFADQKGRVGFVARGEGGEFRNIALWAAEPKK